MKVESLQPPDSHHLQAAIGWLELGNHLEANEELERITASLRSHPEVLWVRLRIYEKVKNHALCHDIALAISERTPKDCGAWVELSIFKFKLGKTQEAYELLTSKANEFPDHSTVRYNLACYACQLGKMREAEEHLKQAIVLGNENEIRKLIMDDPDLEPLRREFSL